MRVKRVELTLCLCVLVLAAGTHAADGRPYLGVRLDPAPLPELLSKHLGLKAEEGIRIQNVSVGSPADKAGLERDDIIVAFQDKRVDDLDAFIEAVGRADVGATVSLDIIHLGQRRTLNVTLEAVDEEAEIQWKHPPEPEAMTSWQPGKIFKIGPGGREWIEVPFDKMHDFDLDVESFFKEHYSFHHKIDGQEYTIRIEGDPADEDSRVIVQSGQDEYSTTIGQLDELPEKYREPARQDIENVRQNVKVTRKRFRLPEPPQPESFQRFFQNMPRPQMEHWSEQRDRVLERIEKQMEQLQERMKQLEQRYPQMRDKLLDRKGEGDKEPEKTEQPHPSGTQDKQAI